jgi:putative ABC transport system permease protein
MRRVLIRGLTARRLRLALTLLAVALGVSLITATYVFTDTINTSFEKIFQETNKGTDAAITPKKFIDTTEEGGTAPTIPPSVLKQVRANPDVLVAQGSVFDTATVLGKDGERIGAGGAPNFIASKAQYPRFEASKITDGRFPRNADEAALDLGTSKKEGFKVGDRITVQGAAPRKDYVIVGLYQLGGVDSFGGATVVELILPEALRILGKPGFDSINAAARDGVTPDQLVASLRRELPAAKYNVRTGAEEARSQSQEISDNLGFLKTFLLIFGFVSLFVGAFIIFNSFSITVAQRTRELGLLRAMGASRRQVLTSVLTEGVLLGFVGSLLGLLLGFALAPGIKALFVAVGVDLPANGLVIEPRTIIVPLLVGTIVAALSSLAPAIRATRVPPMAALREAEAPTVGHVNRRLTIVAGVLLAAGVVLVALGLFAGGSTNATLLKLGAGTILTFVGVALLSPYLVGPMSSAIGWPIERIAGFPGRLARENAMRQPGRTAATAAALMVGVALVTFASVFAAGVAATIDGAVKDNFKGDFFVSNVDGFSPFSAQVLKGVEQLDGVDKVSAIRFSKAKVKGVSGETGVSGIDPATLPELYKLNVEKGPQDAVSQLGTTGGAIVKKNFAEDEGLKVGETLTLTTPTRTKLELPITGIVKDDGGLIADVTVPLPLLERSFDERKDAFGLVGADAGADKKAVQNRIDDLFEAKFPEGKVQTAQEFIDSQTAQVNQLLGLIYALLSLAVIISLFGIVNTLVLSISERTREIGMLRAVGASRRQVRRIVRWEAVITALIGGILGCVVGLGLAVLFIQPLEGFRLAIPFGQIIILILLAGIAGVLAAVWPARRAAKLDVLQALAYE